VCVSNVRTILTVSLLVLACRPRVTGPDASYEKAARIYQQLYAVQLDDAYGDPKMNEAADLLKKVDPHSIDAESAQRMLASIETGRAALQKQQAARNKMADAAAASLRSQQQIDPVKIIAASAPALAKDDKPDSGPQVDPYGPGSSINDLNSGSGGCLTAGEPFREQETNVTGTVYRVGKGPQCGDRLPGLAGQVVLVGKDGRIYRRLTDPTGGAPAAAAAPPDAGVAVATAAPKPPPVAAAQPSGNSTPAPDADAGAGYYLPGMPIPDQLQQAQPPPPPPQ
jgi:hypothetical protein